VTDPDFLTLDDVLALHADQVERYGGSLGIRDLGGLQSALAVPEASFGGAFLHPTLAEMAAAYFFHLSQAHAFIDGNKRIALAAAIAFLGLNGYDLVAGGDEVYDLCMGVAAGKSSKAEVAVFLAAHIRPAS
jgi:death-on-curing protein